MKCYEQWLKETISSSQLQQTQIMPNTASIQTSPTVPINRSKGSSVSSADPSIKSHVDSLKEIHGRLKGIFADLRNRSEAFKNSNVRRAFERELVSGIDSLGRSHSMLAPFGDGSDDVDV